LIILKLLICIIQIVGQDTEPEDLSIRANVVGNEIPEFFSLGDESDTSQPTPECKNNKKNPIIIQKCNNHY